MPTSKRHTRRIKQMACYLNAVINSVMAECDRNTLTREEHIALLRLRDTLMAYDIGSSIEQNRGGIYGNKNIRRR